MIRGSFVVVFVIVHTGMDYWHLFSHIVVLDVMMSLLKVLYKMGDLDSFIKKNKTQSTGHDPAKVKHSSIPLISHLYKDLYQLNFDWIPLI